MRKFVENQAQNLFLYAPFLMAFGAALYFTLRYEPSLILTYPITVALAVLMFVRRVPVFLRGVIIFLFGFYYSASFTEFINTPILSKPLRDIVIVAHVDRIDYATDKTRLYLTTPFDEGDAIVRVSLSDGMTIPNVGDDIYATVNLFAPGPASAPETFDYARWAYFNKLSATGYMTDYRVSSPAGGGDINSLRNSLHNTSNSFLVDSLVLGYKNAVPKADNQIWTSSGVGHVWSISGFHMTLVGGWLFAIFYLIFRTVPYVTRRIPAKIPAMIMAWFGLLFYLFLSGIDVATVRAFLMTTLVFVAFIFGRRAVSLRNVALAFCLIFLLNPHYVMQAGFQLSFAAVFGLVWLYSVVQPKMPSQKILKVVYATILTSVTATVFTAPFVAAHFGTIPIYSVVGNLILLPVFSFLIMPLVMIGLLCALFGVMMPINIAHDVYNFSRGIAVWISDLPLSTVSVSHVPNIAMLCFIIAFVILVFVSFKRAYLNYILFGVIACASTALIALWPRPIFFSTNDNELVAFYENGKLEFNKSRASNHFFAFDTWKQMTASDLSAPNHRRAYNGGVYKFNTPEFNLVYIQKFMPLQNNIVELCRDDSIDYIVSYFDITAPHCDAKILRGGMVIYPSGRIKYTPINRRWNRSPRE